MAHPAPGYMACCHWIGFSQVAQRQEHLQLRAHWTLEAPRIPSPVPRAGFGFTLVGAGFRYGHYPSRRPTGVGGQQVTQVTAVLLTHRACLPWSPEGGWWQNHGRSWGSRRPGRTQLRPHRIRVCHDLLRGSTIHVFDREPGVATVGSRHRSSPELRSTHFPKVGVLSGAQLRLKARKARTISGSNSRPDWA